MNRSMKELADVGLNLIAGEPMSQHTTLGIGGPAEWYAEVFSVPQLVSLLNYTQEKNKPLFFLGAGSNLLVSDSGIPGIVARMRGEFEVLSFLQGDRVRAGSSVFLPNLVKQCADRSLGGIEALAGVPGTVGGALVMNAGTRELEIGAVVQSVEVLRDGNLEILNKENLRFGYRSSSLAGSILCFATLELKTGNKEDILRAIQKFLAHRLKTQPVGSQNVGSVFRNPKGHFAGELIEKAGLKGRRIGNALVSPKHANFIVNCGGATARDVQSLISEIQRTVQEKFGVALEPEIKIVGFLNP
ncbi:MAG: UDP-N-acetylmuramate dehydrogenase [Elusimicrobia bacterium]|nr:UDP-N-acetylmuramate dehydrogenase [Elusimicrobiota bacterium]